MSRNEDIEITTDFEGASLGSFEIRANKVFATFRNEPIVRKDGIRHDYNWHFLFGLKSMSPCEVEIFLNCVDAFGLREKAQLYIQHNVDSDFYPLSNEYCIEAKTDTFKKYHMRLLLNEQILYISNTFFRSLGLLNDTFGRLSDHSVCKKQVIGSSVEGRDITAYLYGDPFDNRPCFLITSGFHPMEADTFATEAIMEFLKTSEGLDLLKHFNFAILPIVNPDGFHHGHNGCNARGVNLYWDFREKDDFNAPEAVSLWRFASSLCPCLYIDFHSYTFQLNRKHASPYIKPLFFYSGEKVKRLAYSIEKEIVALHNGNWTTGPLTFVPSTMAYKLTKSFNTITFAKYHLHIIEGKELLKKRAVDIIKIATKTFLTNGFLDKRMILKYPYGSIRVQSSERIYRYSKILWFFKTKPFIRQPILWRKA